MRKQTQELIALLRRAIAHCHAESDCEDVRGSEVRRDMARQLKGLRALNAKFGKRPVDMFRWGFAHLDGLD
jgi:hypothetical protein